MSKHPDWEDDSFDDFIRRSLEEPPIPFDPKAWEAMEQKLDPAAGGQSNAQKGGNKGGRIAGLVVAILLLSGLGWFVFSGGEKPGIGKRESQSPALLSEQKAIEEQESAVNQATNLPLAENAKEAPLQEAEISQSSSTAIAAPEAEDSRQPEQQQQRVYTDVGSPSRKSSMEVRITESSAAESTAVESEGRAAASAAEKNVNTVMAGTKRQDAMDATPEKSQGTGKALLQGASRLPVSVEEQGAGALEGRTTEKLFVAEKGTAETDQGTSTFPPVEVGVDWESESAVANEERGKEELKSIKRKSWLPFIFSVSEPGPLVLVQQEVVEEAVVLPSKVQERPLSVSLTLAPDFTGTGQQGSTKMGAGFGLQLEYKIWPRLSVVSGAFYSKKNYLTDNSFSPYGKFWDYRPEPDHIDASCGVIDIPLNLRFYALNGSRHRFFLSGGLSSYLMRSEDYTLVYTDGQWDDYTYEVRNENHHLFAIYNLSVGYERNFAGRWALQLEPFMKIPARGVGIGSVKLNSMGAFIHLKYKIVRRGN